MEAWARSLDVDDIAIAGGEMFMHPNLDVWFSNLRRLWPNARIEVPTNGTLLSKRLELSRLICSDKNAILRVSCLYDNPDKYKEIESQIHEVLDIWKDNLEIVSDNEGINYYVNNNLVLRYHNITHFANPYYQNITGKNVNFHMNGDQEESFKKCIWHADYILQHGLLNHCPATVNYASSNSVLRFSPEVVESFKKYTPCDPLKGAEYIKWYINEYKQNSIEVCKHCAYDKRVTDKLFNLKVVQLPSTKL